MATRVVCWNVAGRENPCRELLEMDADVGLLQEVRAIPTDVIDQVEIGTREHWDSHVWNSDWHKDRYPNLCDRWPMVVKLSDRVEIEWFKQVSPVSETKCDEFAVSGIGTVAAARIVPEKGKPFLAVSNVCALD